MVLILSRQNDGSTTQVIQWLVSLKKQFVRIDADNNRTKFVNYDIDNKKLIVSQDAKEFNLFDATTLWHRRAGFSPNNLKRDYKLFDKAVFLDEHDHKAHIESELDVLFDFFHYSLEKECRVLGNYKTDLNKLIVLSIAKECGMKIPEGLIVTKKEQLISLITEKNEHAVITKSLGEGVYKFTKKYGYYSYTERLTLKRITKLPDNFFPSLIQVEIKKKYELRVFYLKGEFYAMAIFSQKDKTTAVDFRKYNQEKPNKTVPYLLPDDVKTKLTAIFNCLSLNTGSVDLIVDKEGNYVFLEINPVGQFAMTSVPCNYYLDKRIAQVL
jgi:ATP-GRASP peptide maturase of grasp-with-spasm system